MQTLLDYCQLANQAKALEQIELRCTQARLAASIGRKKDRTQFLLSEVARIAAVASAAIRR